MIVLPPVRSVAAVTLAQVAALLPPLLVVAVGAPAAVLSQLAAAAMTLFAWEILFSLIRKHRIGFHGATTALIVTVMAPGDVAIWQIVVAVSLGGVLGELIFGGRGFGFVSAAAVALSLLVISFPQVELAAPSGALALAVLPGAALLLVLGLISWQVMLSAGATASLALALGGQGGDIGGTAVAMGFALVFLMCDPVVAAVTPVGRWIYGALGGGLAVLMSPEGGVQPEGLVFAALLAGVFAPLIDHAVAYAHTRRRRRQHV